MKNFLQRAASSVHRHAHWLLPVFVASVVALNWGRWSEWNAEGFVLYLTHPITQTTLYDFAWVLGILTVFIHYDAKKHELRYWYVVLTYPVMPTVGLLVYFWIRQRKLACLGDRDTTPSRS